MFKNYLLTALRHIKRNKAFSLINLLGLSLGIAITLLVSFYVIQESSYNRGHESKDQIYRLNENGKTYRGVERTVSILPVLAGPAILETFPEVEAVLRYRGILGQSLSFNSKKLKDLKVMSFESSLFEFLDFELSRGNEKTVLEETNSVILSARLAKSLFSNENPLNKLVEAKDGKILKVTGVMTDNNRTHFDFDYIIPFKDFLKTQPSFALKWNSASIGTYLKLRPAVDIEELEHRISKMLNGKQNKGTLERLGPKKYFLQPIVDVYLRSENIALSYGERKGDLAKVKLFSIVAIAVLLMACINFINLSTASHVKRTKEVGLRKVIGASRQQLVFQFLTESTLTAFVAGVLAVLFADLMVGHFKDIIQQDLLIGLYTTELIITLIAIVIITGVVAGLYPAWYLSSFAPDRILHKTGKNSLLLRNSLFVFQFSIATIFIVATLIVNKQMSFLKNKDVGFDIENLMYVELSKSLANEREVIIGKLDQSPWIESVSWSQSIPMMKGLPSFSTRWNAGEETQMIEYMNIDSDFIETTGMRFVSGRNFESDEAKNHVIINATAARQIGLENIIGKNIGFYGASEVVGVVEDFHYKSLFNVITPLIFKVPSLDEKAARTRSYLLVRINENNLIKGRQALEATLSGYSDQSEIAYGFLAGSAQRFYTDESKTARAFKYAAAFAIIISSMGLLGLIISSISTRMKEFGIRKVLGASAMSIGNSLSTRFLLLISFSLIISIPIVIYFMKGWLSSFSYSIQISPVEFVSGAALVLLISFGAVSVQVYKAAHANPIDSLKHE